MREKSIIWAPFGFVPAIPKPSSRSRRGTEADLSAKENSSWPRAAAKENDSNSEFLARKGLVPKAGRVLPEAPPERGRLWLVLRWEVGWRC